MNSDNISVGIIGGAGWLGQAIGEAMLAREFLSAQKLWVSGRSASLNGYQAWRKVNWTNDNQELVDQSDVIILSVRPEDFPQVNIRVGAKLVISVMAGVTMQQLRVATGSDQVVRSLPNAAAAISRSYTPWFASKEVSTAQRQWLLEMFSTYGRSDEVLDEAHIDYMTGLTGSGPAFPALFAQAMVNHAISKGLPAAVAYRAVEGVMVDASTLLAGQNEGPQEMLQRFLDYKGTTSAALNTMIKEGIEQAIHKGLEAAEKAAKAMSDER